MKRVILAALYAYAAGLVTPYVLEHYGAKRGDQLRRRNLALVVPIRPFGRLNP